MFSTPADDPRRNFEFIIVGSGAGGGPLACNLAKRHYQVLLIEAGNAPEEPPKTGKAPHVWEVPALHPQSAEDPDLSWQYFVRHYKDQRQSEQDSKWDKDEKGIFYPRATGIGGCTVHNAMVTLTGPADDWDAIASLIDDRSWNSDRMRTYFERLENCHYIRPGYIAPRFVGWLYDVIARYRGNRGRHGFSGWFDTSWADWRLLVKDRQLLQIVLATFIAARRVELISIRRMLWALVSGQLAAELDPNHWKRLRERPEGLALVPAGVRHGRRRSVRDYVIETERAYPEHLTVWTDTLVSRVVFHGRALPTDPLVARGVEFMHGTALYSASPRASGAPPTSVGVVEAEREVILSAGAFNTPQLLMLSGIGPGEHLEEKGITPLLRRAGVGTNLQDRYEVGVVWKMPQDLALLKGITFDRANPDTELQRWQTNQTGLYSTNGGVVSVVKKSRPDVTSPDLFFFAVPGQFRGYEQGFSKEITKDAKHLTWLVLKAHTNNRRGTVRLRSKDPRERPEVNFSYFTEGSDSEGEDLAGIIEGIKFVRSITTFRPAGVKEVWPGAHVTTDAELAQFVKNEAWGHHASCSCSIGPAADPMAVVDSDFRVHGTERLRVVDASVFPKIPGLFIAANIYMIAERATDVIADAYPR